MIGYQFVKNAGSTPPPDPFIVLCEEVNGWIVLTESDDALTEMDARREAAEDLVKELRPLFPDAAACQSGSFYKHKGLASFKSYGGAMRAVDYISKTWNVRPVVRMESKHLFNIGWPACPLNYALDCVVRLEGATQL